MYWTFSHEIVRFEERADYENVTPADYAMEVIGVPEDAQDEVRAAIAPPIACVLCLCTNSGDYCGNGRRNRVFARTQQCHGGGFCFAFSFPWISADDKQMAFASIVLRSTRVLVHSSSSIFPK